jgi:hypothetical protein
MNGVERNGHVLLADSKEATNRNHKGIDFALLIEEYVADLANLGISRIIDVLCAGSTVPGAITRTCAT